MSKVNGVLFKNHKKILIQTSGITGPLGGSSVETILNSIFIPANTFSVGDILTLEHYINKTGTAGTTTWRHYYNTSNSLSGAIQISIRGEGAANRYLPGMRRLVVRSTTNNTYVMNSAAGFYTDGQSNISSVSSTLSLNWTVDSYIILTATNVTTDRSSCLLLKIGN
jgi:hypothetical protein